MQGLTQGSPLWLACRSRFAITGSRVPCLVGCHYESLNSFYQKKVFGKVKKHTEFSVQCMAWGSNNEENAFKQFLRDIKNSDFDVSRGITWKYSDGLHIWAKDPEVAASPDAVAYDREDDPFICLEIKCPFAGKWHHGSAFEMFQKKPQHWIQLQMNMACCDCPMGAFYVWTAASDDHMPERRLILCREDKKFVKYLRTKINWWKEILYLASDGRPSKQLRVPSGWKAEALDEIKNSVERAVFSEELFIE